MVDNMADQSRVIDYIPCPQCSVLSAVKEPQAPSELLPCPECQDNYPDLCPVCMGDGDPKVERVRQYYHKREDAMQTELARLQAIREAANVLYDCHYRDEHVTEKGRTKPIEFVLAVQKLGEALGLIGTASTTPNSGGVK
jgi:hypothetical protein